MKAVARRLAVVASRTALGMVLAAPGGLCAVNRLHAALSLSQKRRFFRLFFEPGWRLEGTWTVRFAGRPIRLPLHCDFPLAWCAAVAFHGYDPEVHAFYEAVAGGPDPPRVVFDVGASYGLHSLRFLVHGARVISFEPNPDCHAYFLECCRLNGVAPALRAVALADAAGTAELVFPAGETYHGTIAPGVRARWGDRRDLVALPVPRLTLDEVAEAEGVAPDLVKIDVEGAELAVLRGARRTLDAARPRVVFESWPASGDRAAIFDLLAGAGYEVQALGLPSRDAPGLDPAGFLAAPASNFLARPRPRGGAARRAGRGRQAR